MKHEALGGAGLTFIIRIAPDDPLRLSGVVERVRTGEKQRFGDSEEMRQIIERMVRAERERPRGVPPSRGP